LAVDLGGQLTPVGSAGAKAATVWRGEADAYVHAGGLHAWDAAAPVAVARAAGLHASRLDGAPLAFNETEPYVPDLLICVPELADPILAWTARHAHEVIR
jgi:3'(2'), 5'-bisphosphate nucleotidase